MYLLIFVLIFAVLGYILADANLTSKLNLKARRGRSTEKGHAATIGDRWRALFAKASPYNAPDGLTNKFRAWASGPGAKLLPADLRIWLASLTDEEAQAFTKSLQEYGKSLGFDLSTLVEGGLDSEPILRQVFVEAIIVYSPAYRRARQARQEVEAQNAAQNNQPEGASNEKAQDNHQPAASLPDDSAVDAPRVATAT
jgi:hypothetical protein